MHPLHAILDWWETLEEFPRFVVATEVCMRLTQHTNIMERHEALMRDFLTERLDATRHVGRAVAVRAVIDFGLKRTVIQDYVHQHLETVETLEHHDLKRLANAAIGRHLRGKPAWDRACRSWRALKRAALSDTSLVSWERACIAQSISRRQK
jgi:hypothetical protein